jgi:uncharacterized membrane protein HdeD (DUF308 family)
MNMKPKILWAWVFFLGILLMVIGSIIMMIPELGLSLISVGGLLMLISAVALTIVLVGEMRKDNKEMKENINEEDLRP